MICVPYQKRVMAMHAVLSQRLSKQRMNIKRLHFLLFLLITVCVFFFIRSGSPLNADVRLGKAATLPELPAADVWGVITTILEVNDAVVSFVGKYSTNLVVVGDQKTNHSEWKTFESENSNVVYLDPQTQLRLGFSIAKHIPWNHFGRKSIGFMFAIASGAQLIFDFDDDNHLSVSTFDNLDNFRVKTWIGSHHVFNPYHHFKPSVKGNQTDVWPRGFPLQFILDEDTYNVKLKSTAVRTNEIAVVQSLANHDPDVDAIYRLTRPLPVYFDNSFEALLSPPGVYVPWNAQAVLLRHAAFFGLMLPITVTGRVSDIWRSYIVSRLLWDGGLSVAFTSPFVTQFRNPHSYRQDFEDEKDLYSKTDDLINALASWDSDHLNDLESAFLDLMKILVHAGFLQLSDLYLTEAWCADLKTVGYSWPDKLKTSPQMRREWPTLRDRPIVDERKIQPQT
jgi:hypothetical protein